MEKYYKDYFLAYHFAFNKGSEWQLAQNCYNETTYSVFLVPRHQFDQLDLKKRKINKRRFIKHQTNLIVCIEPIRLLAIEPKIYNLQRLQYIIWLIVMRQVLVNSRLERKESIVHVNFAQVLTSYGRRLNSHPKFKFKPLGGQGKWYKVKYLATHRRLVNFFLTEVVYKIRCWYDRDISRRTVVHPTLQQFFNSQTVLPAIRLSKADLVVPRDSDSHGRRTVICCGRNVYFKLPELHFKLFDKLAHTNPNLEFLIIGPGWQRKTVSHNFRTFDKISRDELLHQMEHSLCGVNLSLELAGFVNLEMASRMCPIICASSYGADFLLKPTEDFTIDIQKNKFAEIYSHIDELLKSEQSKFLIEAQKQFINSQRWSSFE